MYVSINRWLHAAGWQCHGRTTETNRFLWLLIVPRLTYTENWSLWLLFRGNVHWHRGYIVKHISLGSPPPKKAKKKFQKLRSLECANTPTHFFQNSSNAAQKSCQEDKSRSVIQSVCGGHSTEQSKEEITIWYIICNEEYPNWKLNWYHFFFFKWGRNKLEIDGFLLIWLFWGEKCSKVKQSLQKIQNLRLKLKLRQEKCKLEPNVHYWFYSEAKNKFTSRK